jgi:hypothetical protein
VRHPLLQVVLIVSVILALTLAGLAWLHGDPGPTGPLTQPQYEQQLTRVCAATRKDFDAAVGQPAVPKTTAEFTSAYVQLRVYVQKLSSGLKDLEPQGKLAAPHAAYLAALARLERQLSTLIDAQDKDAPFNPDDAARQRAPVLTAMDQAGVAFTALGLDSTGCVTL